MSSISVEYICHSGGDLLVANVARVSFDKWVAHKEAGNYDIYREEDERLLKFLARENHWTPFGHPHITLRVTAPIPIRTQCFKSKIGFIENEISRRYVTYTPEVFSPDAWRIAPKNSKQGSGEELSPDLQKFVSDAYEEITSRALGVYEYLLEKNVCPEQARFVLPQGVMTSWIWTASLSAFARFYRLRTHSTAQLEVCEVAQKVSEILTPLFPVSWPLLTGAINEE